MCLLLNPMAQAEIAVIGNLHNNTKKMSNRGVQEIFMGRTRFFTNGVFALPLDQVDLRNEFYQKLTQRPIEQINAYWARIMFSGQASPPMQLLDDATIIKTVKENKGAIGYIEKRNANDEQIKILLIIK